MIKETVTHTVMSSTVPSSHSSISTTSISTTSISTVASSFAPLDEEKTLYRSCHLDLPIISNHTDICNDTAIKYGSVNTLICDKNELVKALQELDVTIEQQSAHGYYCSFLSGPRKVKFSFIFGDKNEVYYVLHSFVFRRYFERMLSRLMLITNSKPRKLLMEVPTIENTDIENTDIEDADMTSGNTWGNTWGNTSDREMINNCCDILCEMIISKDVLIKLSSLDSLYDFICEEIGSIDSERVDKILSHCSKAVLETDPKDGFFDDIMRLSYACTRRLSKE
jgi:hypothetical protein